MTPGRRRASHLACAGLAWALALAFLLGAGRAGAAGIATDSLRFRVQPFVDAGVGGLVSPSGIRSRFTPGLSFGGGVRVPGPLGLRPFVRATYQDLPSARQAPVFNSNGTVFDPGDLGHAYAIFGAGGLNVPLARGFSLLTGAGYGYLSARAVDALVLIQIPLEDGGGTVGGAYVRPDRNNSGSGFSWSGGLQLDFVPRTGDRMFVSLEWISLQTERGTTGFIPFRIGYAFR